MSSQPLDAATADSERPESGSALAAVDRALVERWADFTKALAMYPETNARVQESRDIFFDALATMLRHSDRPRRYTEIKLDRDHITVDGVRGEITHGTNLFWLYERVDKGVLEGVRFQLDLQPEPLIAFTMRLLKNFSRRDLRVTPKELWPEPYPGIELLLRKFEGGFHGHSGTGLTEDILTRRGVSDGEPGGEGGGKGTGSGDGDGEGTGTGTGTGTDTGTGQGNGTGAVSREQGLSARLAGDGGVMERIQGIRHAADMTDTKDGEKINVDIVSSVVHMLPVDVMPDFGKVVDLTKAVLDTLHEHVRHEGLSIEEGTVDGGVADLKALLFAASRKYFGRHKKHVEEKAEEEKRGDGSDVNEKAKQGHKGDEKIIDDLDTFLAEYSALPVPETKMMKRKEAEVDAEQLDVYLRFLTELQSSEVVRNLYPPLKRLLTRPGPEAMKVLYAQLQTEWFRADVPDGSVSRNRILNLLQDMKATRLLRECGILSQEHMVECFPQNFGYYIDALDFKNDDDMKELEMICRALGHERVAAAADTLVTDAALLVDGRAERLLSHPSKSLMPFAKILVDRGGDRFRDIVITFLKAVRPSEREACLLAIVDNPVFLSSRYLSLITAASLAADDDRKLKNEVAEALCRFIRSSATVPSQMDMRLNAIRHLAYFPTSRATLLLTELQNARRLWIFKAEPQPIRIAAKLGLEMIQRGPSNV